MRWIWQANQGRRYRQGAGWWRGSFRPRAESWRWPERRREAGVLVFAVRAVESLPLEPDAAAET